MTVALYTHPVCLLHEMGYGHPERPERLTAVLTALDAPEFAPLLRVEAPEATRAQIERMHAHAYVEEIFEAVPVSGYTPLGLDTVLNPQSGHAALRAAGAVCAAVDAVMTGRARASFCAVRPPGHHAERAEAMGFCVFNNVAIGAAQARAVHGARRIAVVDFDVHHGNGTQSMFWSDPDLSFFSTHQAPLYPGTGKRHERGDGNIFNYPVPSGVGGRELRHVFREDILPHLFEIRPELILISAGFDAHRDDPLAELELDESDYWWMTRELVRMADQVCDGRVVSTLEGGYDLGALGRSAAAHVKALMRLD